MKISAIIALCLSSSAVYSAPIVEERGLTGRASTLTGTITDALNQLQSGLQTDETAITQAVSGITKGSLSSVTAAAKVVNSELDDIKNQIQAATKTITDSISSTVGGIAGAASSLVQSDVDQLTQDVQELGTILSGLNANIQSAIQGLGTSGTALISGELTALSAVIMPFVTPIESFATAVTQLPASSGLSVSGLSSALSGLSGIVSGLLSTL